MSNRIESYGSFSRSDIAKNSTAVSTGDFVSASAGFVTQATTSGEIIGLSNQTKTYTADNQTVALEKLSYTVKTDETIVRAVVGGAVIANTDEGKFYNLTNAYTVDGTSGTASESVSPAVPGDVIVKKQLRLVKFVSTTVGDFAIV